MPRRELIDTGTDKRYVRRDANGRFNVGRPLAEDVRTKSRTAAKAARATVGAGRPPDATSYLSSPRAA